MSNRSWVLLRVGLWSAVLLFLGLIVPTFQRFFQGFHADVPVLTAWLFTASVSWVAWSVLVLLAILGLISAERLFGNQLHERPRMSRVLRFWDRGKIAVPTIILAVSVLMVWVPFSKVADGLAR